MKDKIKLFLCELCVWLAMLALATLFSMLLSGCATKKAVPSVTPKEKDSLNIVTLYEVIEVFDTTYVELPKQTAERTTTDSTSTLENDFARSIAAIQQDGSLYHFLETKPQPVPVPTKKRIERKDSTATRCIEKPVPYPVEVEVNRLTWLQQAQIYGCRVLVALLALVIAFKARKRIFRTFHKIFFAN